MSKIPSNFSAVCITSGDYTINHVDHLAIVAYILKAPLFVDSKSLYASIQKYYPQIQPFYFPHHQQILESVAYNYNAIFFSMANYRTNLSPLLNIFYGKKVHFWYCPHGNSDKTLEHYSMQEYALIYGNQMKKRLDKEGHLKHLKGYVETGNIRKLFYHTHKAFYDALVEKEVFSKFAKKQTTLLLAPTWQSKDKHSCFESCEPLIDQLPDHYNLIVKLHPWLHHHRPGFVYLIQEKFKHKKNVVILPAYPLVHPLLERTDLYLGDISSIGYEFLQFNRPLFFLIPKEHHEKEEKSFPIYQCGHIIPKKSSQKIFHFIDKHLKDQETLFQKRQETYTFAFGQQIPFSIIDQNIRNCLTSSSP